MLLATTFLTTYMFFANTLIAIAKVIQQQIDEEQYNIPKIYEELSLLQIQLEVDEITEGEYQIQEDILMDRLRTAQEKKTGNAL